MTAVPLSQSIAEQLDSEQADAVRAFGPRTLIVAGAGSGKTRVLTFGLSHLLEDHKMAPEHIMLLTFTRKAAETMRQRAADVSGRDLSELMCGTFHAVGARLLRDHADLEFSVVDEDEATTMVGQLAAELFQDQEIEGFTALDPARLCGYFQQAREEDTPLDEILFTAPEFYRDRRSLIETLYDRFTERKAEEHLLDYADLLWETREFLRAPSSDALRASLQAVLVDEVQDLNRMQRDIVALLTEADAWRVMVGDPEQSVYGWRGASYSAVQQMAEEPGMTVRKLQTNYRSSAEIVNLSQSVAPDSHLQLTARSHHGPSGRAPGFLRPEDEGEESAAVTAWVQEHVAAGADLENLCVLARAHNHLKVAERAVTSLGYPVALLGRRRGDFDLYRGFLISLMRLALNPHDRMAWQRVLPSLPLDVEEQYARLNYLCETSDPLSRAAGWCSESRFAAVFELLKDRSPCALLWQQLTGGPFADILSAGVEHPERLPRLLADLMNTGSVASEDGRAYLNALVFAASEDALSDGVRMGTIHAAKGLEWKHVLIARCSYEAFPSRMALVEERLDEERRLFYVAVTRAEATLSVCEAPWLSGGSRHSSDFLSDVSIREHFEQGFVPELPASLLF